MYTYTGHPHFLRCSGSAAHLAWVLAVLGMVPPALPAAAPAWPWRDTPLARLEALALIQTLNSQILASSSATRSLQDWCRAHALADPPQIVARPLPASDVPAGAEIRRNLQVGRAELVRNRRVELRCGERVLAIADNWYVPARLTPAMNRTLDTTQQPFGMVVQPLSPHRQTLAVTLLWSPLPEGWERAPPRGGSTAGSAQQLAIPAALFEHYALVYAGNRQPLAEVHEVYQHDILAFEEPQLPDVGP
jgi:chorismate-pyruvate lyase